MEAYQNAALSPEERAKDLLGKMTLQEKVGQLNQRLYGFRIYERQGEEFTLTEEFKEEVERMGGLGVLYGLYRADPWADKDEKTGIVLELSAKAYNIVQKYVIDHSRLGIPMMMSTECPHGHQALGGGLLPVNLAAGATFDPELLSEGYKACGKQLKSGHVDLALMSALDMARDPRWGRSEECYSEDPCLAASMAKAAVTGMQSTGVGSVAKHFCAQGETTGGVNASAARIGERELREIHFPSAKACCEAGVEGIMAAYNEIDGVYCHRNAWLLRDVLRGEMGFDGIVMADGLAVDFLKNTEGDTLHAGVAARKAGVDVSLWDEAFSRLGEAVEQGLLDESEIDESVLKVLKLKFEKGLFEHPYMEENMLTPEEAGIPEVSLSLARESAVLLKNEESVLPLAKKYKKVAVIGYHAADRYCMLGDYTPPVPESECVTVLQGMKQEAPEGVEVSYAMGSEFSEADEDEKAKALALAAKSDVIVAVVGGSSSRFGGAVFDANGAASKGTGSRSMDCGEGMDTAKVHIPAAQEELVAELARLGKPMVTVVIAGRAYCIDDIENASCEFDVETLSPTYRLLIGIPGKSNAFAISEKLGLPDYIIQDAKTHLTEEDESFEDLLTDLEQSRKTIEKEREEVASYRREMERLKSELKNQQEKLDTQRDRIIREANARATDIVQEAKDFADETMKNFRKFGKASISASEMEKERERIRKQLSKTENKNRLEKKKPSKAYKASDFHLGDSVKVLSMNLTGTVNSLPDAKGNLFVQMGILRSQVNISDLELIEEPLTVTAKQMRRTSSGKMKMGKSMHVSPEINLLGKTVDEAVAELDKYLDDAYIAHLSPVRIVHGKGTGALRNGIHQYLRRQKHIKSFRLGAFGEGDAGVTIVEFK